MKDYMDLEETMIDKDNSEPVPTCTKFFLHKSMRLIKYYLQYAAINSQIKNHTDAFSSRAPSSTTPQVPTVRT